MLSSKRHFTAVIDSKEYGIYVSSTPSSAAKKVVSKLCAEDKKRKVKFSIRETTRDSNKKVYGPYIGYMQKLNKPIELEGRVIRYKPVAKLDKKISKMKGGKIIGFGTEGYILQPNMNNSSKPEFVSKLIQIDDERLEKLISFESKLNEIDPSGEHHIPMIIERSRRITSENINRSNLEEQEKQQLRSFKPNYKITYEFGGISIEEILKKYNIYSHLFDNDTFFKNFLLGLVNVINGLLKFSENGIYHSDLHEGNIVFPIDYPEIMRLIDFGNLIEERYNWTTNYKLKINLYSFFNIFTEFINTKGISDKVRNIFVQIKNIPEFTEYKKFPNQSNQSDFQENAFRIIIEKMLKKINELLRT
jgi:hypothetical protein